MYFQFVVKVSGFSFGVMRTQRPASKFSGFSFGVMEVQRPALSRGKSRQSASITLFKSSISHSEGLIMQS